MAYEDGDGQLRRGDGTFTSLGSAAEQAAAGVNHADTVDTARGKMSTRVLQNDTHEKTMQFLAAGGVMPAYRVTWWMWGIAALVALFVVYALISGTIKEKAEGPQRRAQLLAWAAGDDAQALMGLTGAWQATFPGRQPPIADMDVVSAVGEIQRRNEAFFQGGKDIDLNQMQPLLGRAFKCLSDDAAACMKSVADRQSELDARARAPSPAKRPSVVAVPWDNSRSAGPTLLNGARQYLSFERLKAKGRGAAGSELNDDGAVAAILGLCLRDVQLNQATTPKGCADWSRARLAEGQGSSNAYPITKERLAMMDGWRWKVAAWSFDAALKNK